MAKETKNTIAAAISNKIFEGVVGQAVKPQATKEGTNLATGLQPLVMFFANIADNVQQIAYHIGAQITSMRDMKEDSTHAIQAAKLAKEEAEAEKNAGLTATPVTVPEKEVPEKKQTKESIIGRIVKALGPAAVLYGAAKALELKREVFGPSTPAASPAPSAKMPEKDAVPSPASTPVAVPAVAPPAPVGPSSIPTQAIQEPLPVVRVEKPEPTSAEVAAPPVLSPPSAIAATPKPTTTTFSLPSTEERAAPAAVQPTQQAPSAPTVDTNATVMPPQVEGRVEQLENVVRKADPGVLLAGLREAFKARLAGLAAEFKKLTGKKLTVTSGFRTREKQEKLYREKGGVGVAKPGTSLHESGVAVDIDKNDANKAAELGLFERFRLFRPLVNWRVKPEPWHVEPIERKGLLTAPDGDAVAGGTGKPVDPGTGKPVAVAAAANTGKEIAQRTAVVSEAVEKQQAQSSNLFVINNQRVHNTVTNPQIKIASSGSEAERGHLGA